MRKKGTKHSGVIRVKVRDIIGHTMAFHSWKQTKQYYSAFVLHAIERICAVGRWRCAIGRQLIGATIVYRHKNSNVVD